MIFNSNDDSTEEFELDSDKADNHVYKGSPPDIDTSSKVIAGHTNVPEPIQETKIKEGKKKGYTEWIQRGENTFVPSEEVVVVSRVPAGLYSIKYAERVGFYFFKESYHSDEILELPTENVKKVIKEISDFWGRSEIYKRYKFAHKRGILLHGAAGNGKSSIINLVINDLIKNQEGIVITIKSKNDLSNFATFMPEYFKSIEKDRPVVVIIEDIEGILEYSSEAETLLLNLLDGLEQMEKMVYIATTNYPERLKARLLNRPSRFDIRLEIKNPTPEVRKYFFLHKLQEQDIKSEKYPDAHDIDKWVEMSDGLTMADLKEMIISTVLLGNSLEETMEKLTELKKKPNSSDYGKETSSVGYIKKTY